MGTRGFRIIKFKGRYWIFYNHFDSYPDGLGKSLVEAIPTDPEAYQNWLQSQRDFFAEWESLLQNLLCIQPRDLQALYSSEPSVNVWGAAFDERMEENLPSCAAGFNDLYIKWIYTIDLDLEVYSVDNGAHFELSRIPTNGGRIDALSWDHNGERIALPQYVPEGTIASLTLQSENSVPNVVEYYNTLRKRVVIPKTHDGAALFQSVIPKIRWELFDAFQKSLQRCLSVTLLGWTVQDFAFRELAYFILCLAIGNEHLTLVDQRRVIDARNGHMYAGIVTPEIEPEQKMEFVSVSGAGYHLGTLAPGSAPDGSRYWLEGALVCLVSGLDCSDIMTKAIADAVRYGRIECACPSFNAIVMSIEIVVMIKSFPDGDVDHTELLQVLHINTHLSKNAHERYGEDVVEALYQAEVKECDHVESDDQDKEVQSNVRSQIDDQSRERNVNDGAEDRREGAKVNDKDVGSKGEYGSENAQEDKSRGTRDSENREVGRDDQPVWTLRQTFMSLVHFFEVATLESLKPTNEAGRKLPNEACEMILREVSDIGTYNACMKVSRNFRSLCQQRPMIMDGVSMLEPPPNEELSKRKDRMSRGKKQRPRFCAIDLSNGRRMNVEMRTSKVRSVPTDYMIVAGLESNRKTFPPFSVEFAGLDLAAPSIEVSCASTPDYLPDRVRDDQELIDDIWRQALEYNAVTADSASAELADFWMMALKSFEVTIIQDYVRRGLMVENGVAGAAWKLPPNTREIHVGYKHYGKDRFKYFHCLILRLKRASKYWGGLWDDLIDEARERLATIDDSFEITTIKKVQVREADDPLVTLCVGLEVRLFRWEQPKLATSLNLDGKDKKSPLGTLHEIEPLKVYMISEPEDRKVIEEHIRTALEQREMKKRELTGRGQEKEMAEQEGGRNNDDMEA